MEVWPEKIMFGGEKVIACVAYKPPRIILRGFKAF